MQGTVKRGRRQGTQKKRWEDNIREWTSLEFAKSQRQWRTEKNGGNWLINNVWCPNDPRGYGLDDDDEGAEEGSGWTRERRQWVG